MNKKNINYGKIKVPPLSLQTQFANIVTKTEALKEQYKNSLQELENLYGSLSQRAFKGELIVDKSVIKETESVFRTRGIPHIVQSPGSSS